jgi:hypothetical protein
MLISLLGLFTIADGHGPEMDLGAGLRYRGEIIAFPEILRGAHPRWEPVSERQARLTIDRQRRQGTSPEGRARERLAPNRRRRRGERNICALA